MNFRLTFSFLVLSFALLPACAQSTTGYDNLVQEGNRQLQVGDLSDALATANRAIALDHGRWQAYALSGGALMNLKRYEEAADSLSKAIDRAPATKQSGLRELPSASALTQPATASPATTTTQAEVVMWKSIESSKNQSDFQGYLSQYPNGAFVALAQTHLNELQSEEKLLQEQQSAGRTARLADDENAWAVGFEYDGIDPMHNGPRTLTLRPDVIRLVNGKNQEVEFTSDCADLAWTIFEDRDNSQLMYFHVKGNSKTFRFQSWLRSAAVSNLLHYCGQSGMTVKH
jgi:tetratricopeptide (TPR) repeat protein